MSIPLKDALLVPWANNFAARISAPSNPYAIASAQQATMTDRAEAFNIAYDALMAARADGTRAASQTAVKTAAKTALLDIARELYAFVSANTSITDSDKILAGVHVRDVSPSPIPVPSSRPGMDLVSVVGRTVTYHVHDSASSTKRGKAPGATSAWVYTFVGSDYPSDPSLWQFQGGFTKPTVEIVFPDTVPNGAQVWACAAWVNAKSQAGPASVPITTNIQGGGSAVPPAEMKIAA